VIVDDVPDDPAATANALAVQLNKLMADDDRRGQMAAAAGLCADTTAAGTIAARLVALCC